MPQVSVSNAHVSHPQVTGPQAIAQIPSSSPGSLRQPMYGQVAARAPTEPSAPVPSPAASFVQGSETPSASLVAAPRRPTTLIAIVLVIDLALAAAGGILLAKGLTARSAPAPKTTGSADPTPGGTRAPTPAPVTPAGSEVAASGGAPSPSDPPLAPADAPAASAPTRAVSAPTPAASAPTPAARVKAAADQPHHHATSTPNPRPAGPAPVDPYATTLDNEVELQATRSRAAFASCAHEAGEVHGEVRVAFRVQPDGHPAHVAPVFDSTGAGGLATCLAAVIARWTFAVHPSTAMDFVRPFSYP
jgi:hypothetical protein